MALTEEELAQLGAFVKDEVSKAVDAVKADVARPADVAPEPEPEPAKPEYYVHLADGRVFELADPEASDSHYEGVAVIGRYPIGA